MAGEPSARTPDRSDGPPAPEGAGPPPNPDPGAEAKRRDIERGVYERRIETDKQAEGELAGPGSKP